METVTLGKASEIVEGNLKPFVINGKDIAVANIGGQFYAIGRHCTHRQGDLTQGVLEDKIVTCPRHGSQFDVTTGKNLRGPKIGLVRIPSTPDEPSYPVKIENGEIKIII